MFYLGIHSSIGILGLGNSGPDQDIFIVTCCNTEQLALLGHMPLSPFLLRPIFKLQQAIGGY